MQTAYGAGRNIPLVSPQTLIGRDEQCHIRIPLQMISPIHCHIEQRSNHMVLIDHGSETGSYLNEQRVASEVQIQHGDTIKVGGVKLLVELQ